MTKTNAERVNLPPKPFLYTIDQIAYLLSISEAAVRAGLLHYEGRSPGILPKTKMRAVNVAPNPETEVEWRVPQKSLVNFLRHRGVRCTTGGFE